MGDDSGGGIGPWAEWARLIVSGMEAQDKRDDRIEERAQENRVEIEKLKVELRLKSGIFGFLGSLIPVFIFIMYEILKKVIK
jgi:hypothetical protein